ncbi:acyltransferase family protein [Agromyces sp. Marseille-Q5079]|uniref:acyltransferase family protein n=1 Tax=Agromyces sp. Marseille-Q5079 TaxID=3439059 RepID=UPI003D9C9821
MTAPTSSMASTADAAARRLSPSAVSPAAVSAKRLEIEGLRTVAALLVATYHIWFDKVSGGVDVFFVITGFLITLTLVGHVRREGRIRPLQYLGRLARRVWPMAAVVLVAALAITVTLAPEVLRARNFTEILASALYVENEFLAVNAVDYLNAEDPHTIVQHFWAMTLQGQFYVIWLLVALGSLWFALRPRQGSAGSADATPRFRGMFAGTIALVAAASFAWSLWQTSVAQPTAYFSTTTRLWEFGVGGLIALAGTRLTLRGAASAIASWVGLVGLIICGMVLPVSSSFPGVAALWPVSCAALLLVATRHEERPWAATRVLASRPLVWLGGVAFGIYLWHWPLLVSYRYVFGQHATPNLWQGSLIIALAIGLAVLGNRLVERRVSASWLVPARRPLVAVLLIGAWIAVMAGAGLGIAAGTAAASQLDRDAASAQETVGTCFGAGALGRDAECAEVLADQPLVPDRAALLDDTGGAYACYTQADAADLTTCTAGDGPTRIALIGNSHAAMYRSLFEAAADGSGWSITTITSNGCVWGLQTAGDPDVSDRCRGRLEQTEQLLFGDEPFDLVVYAGGRGEAEATPAEVSRIAENWSRLAEVGTEVVVIEDNPRIGDAGATCVIEAPEADLRAGACDVPEADATAIADRYVGAARLTGAPIVPTLDLYCVDGRCPAVVGSAIVYRDQHHATATYLRSTAPQFFDRFDAAAFDSTAR